MGAKDSFRPLPGGQIESEAGDPDRSLERSNSQRITPSDSWSGPAEGHTQGVIIAVANELIPSGFNAQLESSRTDFEDVVNPHGWGNRSSINESRLLQFARQGSLLIP